MKKFFSLFAAVLFAASMMATEVVFTNADFAGQGTANTGSEVSATKDGVTFTCNKGYSATESLRCYAHAAISITASSTISKINFTTTGGKDGGLDAEVAVNATSYEVADLASQARFTEIKVTIDDGEGGEGGEGGDPEPPVVSGVVTFTNADFAGQGTANTGSEVSATKDGVTFTCNKGYSATESLRCYAHAAISITASSTISKINFTTTGGKDGGLDAEVAVNATSYEVADLASQARFTEIKVTLAGGVVPPTPAVAAPVIAGDAEFTESTQVSISCETASAAIYYTLDGADPTTNSLPYDNPFTLTETATVKAVAYDSENNEYSAVVEKTFTKVEPATPISLSEFIEAAPTTEVTLKPLTVIFASGKNTYVIDEEGIALVIYDANKTYYDGTLTAGKVLTGQKATYTLYKNQSEIIPTNTAVASDGVAPVPTELDAAPTDEHINHFVSFKNVEATLNNKNYYIFSNVQLYGATGSLKPTEEGNYDVEGLYIVYNGTQPELIVTAIAPASATAINNTADEVKAFKTIENGQLVIIKNGVRYDATGAVIR